MFESDPLSFLASDLRLYKIGYKIVVDRIEYDAIQKSPTNLLV